MQFLIKLVITILIILFCAQIAKTFPTLAGLIATAPITTLIVLLWIYSDKPGDYVTLSGFVKGVLWGTIPTILFYIAAYFCLTKRLPISVVLGAGFGVWLISAFIHQLLLK